jgi:hypothetical protein
MPLRREHAPIALATIRLVNGALALLAPGVMLRRLGADPRTNEVAVYPLRMFGTAWPSTSRWETPTARGGRCTPNSPGCARP